MTPTHLAPPPVGGSFSVAFSPFPLQESLPSYLLPLPTVPPVPWAAPWEKDPQELGPHTNGASLLENKSPGMDLVASPSSPSSSSHILFWPLLPFITFSAAAHESKAARTHRAGFQEEVSLSWILEC